MAARKQHSNNKPSPSNSQRFTTVPQILFHSALRGKDSLDESLAEEKILNLRIAWTTKDSKYVQQWLKTKDFDHLADLLRQRPHNMANPLVFHQILHLRALLNWGAWDEQNRGCTALVEGQTEPLEYEVVLNIRAVLHQLLGAWVGSMLPGFEVQRIVTPPRKGPPSRLEDFQLHGLLDEFNHLMVLLEGEEEPPLKKKEEAASAFCKRVAGLVQRLHRKSYSFIQTDPRNCEWSSSIAHNGRDLTVNDLLMMTDRLKASIALSVARQSIGKKGHVLKRKLVYSLLALHHPYLGEREKVRGHIERAEERYASEHRYKAPKRKASHLV